MAKDHGSSVKNDKQYEGLRKKGMSKSRAAAIANTPGASKKGGKNSGKKRSSWPPSAPDPGFLQPLGQSPRAVGELPLGQPDHLGPRRGGAARRSARDGSARPRRPTAGPPHR